MPYPANKKPGNHLARSWAVHHTHPCTDFRDIRNEYFVASTIWDMFEQVTMCDVIKFIK